MEKLYERFLQKIDQTQLGFTRHLLHEIHWDSRLIGIKGARGVGKTTLILQYIKQQLAQDQRTLYVSLDHIWFAGQSLYDLADQFVKKGGAHLFLDEVHKYPNWSQELKNIYDDFPTLQVVFTGSSLLEMLNASADLSRRAVLYTLQGLSFREYLNLTQGTSIVAYSLSELLANHTEIARQIAQQIKPLASFSSYLETGYYPFFQEAPALYLTKLEQVMNLILEVELPLLRKVEIGYVNKLKQLLYIIAVSVPYVPNVSQLSERIGLNRNTLVAYLSFLQEANLTKHLYKDAKGLTQMQKPDKIYLENTNLQYALAREAVNSGSLRETFFMNQLSCKHNIEYAPKGDFIVDRLYTFETGGRNKTDKQIQGIDHSFVVSDQLEIGFQQKIPLWVFGLLY
jgi:predicted AAA+ superfamily ATPase